MAKRHIRYGCQIKGEVHSWRPIPAKGMPETHGVDFRCFFCGERRTGPRYEPPLDVGIAEYVHILNANGIHTIQSCQGGPAHAYAEPTIQFEGSRSEGFRALAVAMESGLPVDALRRVWFMNDGEPDDLTWEITFSELCDGRPSHHHAQLDAARKG